jgi:hypothetical protein
MFFLLAFSRFVRGKIEGSVEYMINKFADGRVRRSV